MVRLHCRERCSVLAVNHWHRKKGAREEELSGWVRTCTHISRQHWHNKKIYWVNTMKFAKHLARAMEVSDPEWHPFWVNYKQLKKVLKQPAAAAASNNSSSSPLGESSAAAAAALAYPRRPGIAPENGASHRGDAEGVAASVNTTKEELEPAAAGVALTAAVVSCNPRAAAATGDRAVNGESNSTSRGSGTPPREDQKLARGVRDSCRDVLETASGVRDTASSAVVLACCGNSASSCAASAAAATANASGVPAASPAAVLGGDSTAAGAATQEDAQRGLLLQQRRRRRRQCECPFFSALLREVDKCRIFFLENEDELQVRCSKI